jgi:hypothetical protein
VQISHGSAHQIINKNFTFIRFLQGWFPNNSLNLDMCSCLFDQYYEKGDHFLSHTVTGDETDPSLSAHEQMSEYEMETHSAATTTTPPKERVQISLPTVEK